MQPFGLLDFLKLVSPPTTQETPPSTTAKTDEPSPAKQTAPPEPPAPSPNEDAYRAFIDRHDQRAKRIKKER